MDTLKRTWLACILFSMGLASVAYPDISDMVLIPAGEYEMGDHFNDGDPAELPIHTVYVNSFYIRKYETTNRMYCDFLNAAMQAGEIKYVDGIIYGADDSSNRFPYCDTQFSHPSSQIDYSGGLFSVRTKSGRDMSNDPMVTITWYGSAAYCNWLSRQEGHEACYDVNDPNWPCDFGKKGYRLPTEAEWEYAARGNQHAPYARFPWGDTITHSQANYWSDETIPYDLSPTREYHPLYNDGLAPFTAPVGTFSPNGYGLYEMAGNAFEWVNDWYDADYFSVSPYDNPRGPASGTFRILLGGGWGYEAFYCRNSVRLAYEPDSRCHYRTFRFVLEAVSPVLEAIPAEFHFESETLGVSPPDQVLTISNIGGGLLEWQIAESCDWLQVIPSAGTCASGQENAVTLRIEVVGLPFDQDYLCQMTVWDPNAQNSPIMIPVSFVYTTDCFSSTSPAYADWLAFGSPDCWCYERNCRGDANGKGEGALKCGYKQVYLMDLNILSMAYNIAEPPKGPGIGSLGIDEVPAICADFARDREGSTKTSFKRVYLHDLNILTQWYGKYEPPLGPGIPLCPLTTAGGDIVYYKYPQ
jgi:sulfatase modifying factor 1